MTARLPVDLSTAVAAAEDDWRTADKVRRLWFKDPALWTGQDEGSWLGWLNIPNEQLADLDHLTRFAAEVKARSFTHVLLLGMGGSSLCPEVLSKTFGRRPGWPELVVLDSTDPRQVAAAGKRVQLSTTLVVVSSKSGSTLEPNILKDYFLDRMKDAVGPENAGDHFAAVTDPGSPFEKVAREAGFKWVFHGVTSIGGRYSALSDFGLVPAAAMGLDVARLLGTAAAMAGACAAPVPPADNPGVALGLVLGEAARRGRDKLTLLTSPGLRSVGTWLEQLVAESTGKQGKGIVPVDREPVGPPSAYGTDRLFAYLKLAGESDGDQDRAVEALERSGQPVVRIGLPDRYDLGAEFFRWEFATAVAGAVLGINPFDQPDVEASKIETRKLTTEYEKSGKLPAEQPLWAGDGVTLYADPRNAAELAGKVTDGGSLRGFLAAHLGRLKPGDYFALLAYLPLTEQHEKLIDEARVTVRDRCRVATCGEFGPRFLHSTGQAYKGGPNTGVFLQLTCDEPADVPVPGKRYTFGAVKAAQARGDFQVLADRGRRALRVHLGGDVAAGLAALRDAIRAVV
jgi:transaldolase/glucose-6-phosphate isomerase